MFSSDALFVGYLEAAWWHFNGSISNITTFEWKMRCGRFSDASLHRYVSPRKRAQRTFELLNLGLRDPLPWTAHGEPVGNGPSCEAKVVVTEDIREWDYGDYEGITTPQIKELRQQQGLNPAWDIWRDGCPGGE